MFQSYKKPKYYTKGGYSETGTFKSQRGTKMAIMCKNCGYAYGYHYGSECPKPNDNKFPPIFYSEVINTNIKVI